MTTDSTTNGSELVDPARRRAIKLGAATAAATVVWAEPTIKGLARRPAYASTGSAPINVGPTGVIVTGLGQTTGLPIDVFNDGTLVVELIGPLADGNHSNNNPMGVYRLVASATGCTCVWQNVGAVEIKRGNSGTPTAGVIPANGDTITFNWTGNQIANRFQITSALQVICTPN